MVLSSLFKPVTFDDIPGWAMGGHLDAFYAFRRCAGQARLKPYKTGALGVDADAFGSAFDAATGVTVLRDGAAARRFFEAHFRPYRIDQLDGAPGLLTGFYEPEVAASNVRTSTFTVPILGRPADLIDMTDANRPASLDPYLAFARQTDTGPVEYHDRRAIDCGALAGQGLELAWVADKVDLFFVHVQGAARLIMPDGSTRRITYAAKSGQRFTGIGRVLADLGEIPLENVTMQSIRAWLKSNPSRVDEILWHNRSYIFFREAPVDDPSLGPIAAAKVQLTAGHSLAVDRLLHTFGTPFFIDAPTLTAFEDQPFRRLMIAQDTGSAIVGPARGDIFAGSGDAAGEIAGVIRNSGSFYALLPATLAERQ